MYDITIVGAGISGIFLAYTLLEREDNLKILMLEKGKSFDERICPIESGVTKQCIECTICNKLQGFGGMSRCEGKYNYTNDFGGKLGEKIGNYESLQLMKRVDEILETFGGDKVKLFSTRNEELSKRAESCGCRVLTTNVRHLGTELSYEILRKLYAYLEAKIDIKFEVELKDIHKDEEGIFKIESNCGSFDARKFILATGISGKEDFLNYCGCFDIKPHRERIDLGIRVEMRADQMKNILKGAFETKIACHSDKIDATTYCMNPRGRIIKKHQYGLVMPDGQNYLETDSPSFNLNFTVMVPTYFSSSAEARAYAKDIIGSINKGRGRIVVQTLGDLLKNEPTTIAELRRNSIPPTLEAEGGNIYDEVPQRYIEGLFHIFNSIEKLSGEKIDRDTLLYGIDAKFYEPEIEVDSNFETREKNFYIVGDCSGVSSSLSQAAASGVALGRHLLEEL